MNTFEKIWNLTTPKDGVRQVIVFGIAQALLEIISLFALGSYLSMLSLGEQEKNFSILGVSTFLSINWVAFFLCLFFFLRLILGIYNISVINKFSSNIESELKHRLLCRYQNLQYEERMNRGVGEMFDAVYGWTASFARAVVAPAGRVINDSLTALTIVCYFVYLYPKIVLSFAIFLVILIYLWDKVFKKRAINYANNYRKLSSEIADELHDALVGYKEIRALNLTSFFAEKFKSKVKFMTSELSKSVTLSQSPRLMIEALIVLVAVFSLLIAKISGIDYRNEIPNIAILAVGLLRLATLMNLSATLIANLRTYTPIINSLNDDLMTNNSTLDIGPNKKTHEANINLIIANSLDIGYSQDQILLKNFSFTIETGQKIALVGHSGSGKSTLLNVLMGLIKPRNGELKILMADGSVRQNLLGLAGYLSQDTFILADSIRRNVAIGQRDDEIDDKLVITSLSKAQLSDFAQLDLLDKQLGSFGSKLSGGQRQRISLARAFYLNKKVLIFDESTSALDFDTENEIVDQILTLGADITVVFVTHRINVADRFDIKITLENYN